MSNVLSAGRSSPEMSLEEKTKLEVSRWYKHFYNWSRGLVPKDDSHVRLVFDALSADFRVVLTNGNTVAREDYYQRLYGLHGERSGRPGSEIRNLRITTLSDEYALAVFDLIKEGFEKKVDTALMRLDSDSPSGISWVHVHESAHQF